MMKNLKTTIAIAIIVLLLGVPVFINLLYYPHRLLISTWSPGDLLSYLGSILVGGAAIYVGYQANRLVEQGNKINERIMENEQNLHKSYVSYYREKSGLYGNNLHIELRNITEFPIVEATAHASHDVKFEGECLESEEICFKVHTFDKKMLFDIKKDCLSLDYTLDMENGFENGVFSAKIDIKNIFGFKNELLINLSIIDGGIFEGEVFSYDK